MPYRGGSIIPPIILLILISFLMGCKEAPKKEPEPPKPPHLRYFESTQTGSGDINISLYDYDLNTLAKEILWQLDDKNIDRVEFTPEGRFLLVHYAIAKDSEYYYVVYDLDGPDPSIPMTFTRGGKESSRVSAYDGFLDDAVYKYGFVIGDPEFTPLTQDPVSVVYQFAWVDLATSYVEEIPLITTLAEVPEIIFVPLGGGYFDFILDGAPEILRFHWDTRDRGVVKELYDPQREPVLKVDYIGSFDYFADFQKPGRAGGKGKAAMVGIRGPDNVIPLDKGDFPLWSLGDAYIFIRIFPPDVMERIALGFAEDAFEVLTKGNKKTKFAIYDISKTERREISLTLDNPYAMPLPIYDATSNLLALSYENIQSTDINVKGPSTYSIIVFDIAADKNITVISGLPKAVDTAIAFYRP